jgi:CO/xanthine dehydrogenase Mo-binding subunit
VRSILFEVAAVDLDASPANLIAAQGMISVKDDPERCMAIADVAGKANFAMRKLVVGRGHPGLGSGADGCGVDTETGQVDVLKLTCAYDVRFTMQSGCGSTRYP